MNEKKTTLLDSVKAIFVRDTLRESIAVCVTLAYLCFQVYRTFIRPLPPLILRPIHISSIGLLCFLYNPIKGEGISDFKRIGNQILDIFVFVAVPFQIFYAISQYSRLVTRINYLDPVLLIDHIACISLLVIIFGGIWRIIGVILPIFVGIFVAYAWVAPYLGGIFYYKGITLDKFTDLMVMSNDGIYGTASGASAGFMYWIMIFGALFALCGGGQVLIDIGMKFGTKSKDNSGPAKAAVIASGLMGMISGSAAANVAGTGVFTIPMMKEVGYTPEEAGAIEAVASTGGQIMPPIMGTGAFLMAELIGVSYARICLAATIPAVVYYAAVFLLVHLLARKKARTVGKVTMNITAEPILPRLYLLSPMVVLVIAIGMGYTLQRAALYGILAVIILNVVSPRMRQSPIQMLNHLLIATKRTSSVAVPIGACGIIIGIVSITGFASRLSGAISAFSGDMMWVALIITMIGCMLLGMALPTIASYLTAYILFLPTLRSLGISALAANMFIFYFGIFAQITPPVCVASYTAAGIAGGKAWDTGWKGFSYALCAFFAPFVFVYQPGLLMEGTLLEIVSAAGILVIGTVFLTMGLAGYVFRPMIKIERVLFVIAGVLVCIPETISDRIGMVLGAALIVFQYVHRNSYAGKFKDPELAAAGVRVVTGDTTYIEVEEDD